QGADADGPAGGADPGAGREGRPGVPVGEAFGQEGDALVEVGAGAVELLVGVGGALLDDAAQVEPGAKDLVQPGAGGGEESAKLLVGADGFLVDARRRRPWD